MKRILFLLAALAMAGNASALEFSQMQMKKYDNYTKVTCSYRMPKIESSESLYFEFAMSNVAGPSGTDSFQFTVRPEENRYVEFGPNGTKVILRKTTKGIWKIALVRQFYESEGKVVCGGAIREYGDVSLPTLSNFRRLDGYFDSDGLYYETTWTLRDEGYAAECWSNECRDEYADFYMTFTVSYTYRHDLALGVYCGIYGEPGCVDYVVKAGREDLTDFSASVELEASYYDGRPSGSLATAEFSIDDVTEFDSVFEVLSYVDPGDNTSFHWLVLRATDRSTGYSMFWDGGQCDGNHGECLEVDFGEFGRFWQIGDYERSANNPSHAD